MLPVRKAGAQGEPVPNGGLRVEPDVSEIGYWSEVKLRANITPFIDISDRPIPTAVPSGQGKTIPQAPSGADRLILDGKHFPHMKAAGVNFPIVSLKYANFNPVPTRSAVFMVGGIPNPAQDTDK